MKEGEARFDKLVKAIRQSQTTTSQDVKLKKIANKVRGIRASVCHDKYSAQQGVEHDDINVLCIGGRVVDEKLAMDLVSAFVDASFTGEARHKRRLLKVLAMEAAMYSESDPT